MLDFVKKLFIKINKLDNYVNKYKESAGEVSLPSVAYMNWGIRLLDEGKKEEAFKLLEKSAQMPYLNSESYVNLGIAYAHADDYNNALSCFKKATKLDRNNARAYQMLGMVYSEIDDFKNAKKAFNISIKLDPRSPQAYLNQGIYHAKINELDNAANDFKKACKLNPMNPHSWFLWGVLCSQRQEFDSAYDKLKKAVAINPFFADAYYHLASIAFIKKNFIEAVNFAKKSIAIDPVRTESYIVLAESWLQLKNESECFSVFQNIDEKVDKNDKFYYSYGAALQYFGKWEEAIEKLTKSYELNSSNHITTNAIATSYLKIKNEDMAIKWLEKTVEISPQYFISLYNLGQIRHLIALLELAKRKDFDRAVEYFKRALEANIDSKHVYINIASAYDSAGNAEEALTYWKKAVEYNPDNIDAKINLANAYYRAGDIKGAIRKMRGSYKENKNNKKVLFMYGILLLTDNDCYSAVEKFDEALAIDENFDVAKYAKIECLLKMGKIQEANDILLNLEQSQTGEKPEILYLRLVVNFEMIQKEDKKELIKQSEDICDKIFSEYKDTIHSIEKVKTIKEELTKLKEN